MIGVSQASVPKTEVPCPICGDVVSGFHYGIRSCESCKSFFKRCMHSKKKRQCVERKQQCVINVWTRKICCACRFNRCIVAGMKPDGVRAIRVRGGRSIYEKLYKKQRLMSSGYFRKANEGEEELHVDKREKTKSVVLTSSKVKKDSDFYDVESAVSHLILKMRCSLHIDECGNHGAGSESELRTIVSGWCNLWVPRVVDAIKSFPAIKDLQTAVLTAEPAGVELVILTICSLEHELLKEFHENLEIKCDSLDISPPSWHHGLRRVSESYKHFNLTLQQLSWLAIAMIYNSGIYRSKSMKEVQNTALALLKCSKTADSEKCSHLYHFSDLIDIQLTFKYPKNGEKPEAVNTNM